MIFIPSLIYSQNRWEFVNPLPTGFHLYDIEKTSEGDLLIFGEFGTILKSSDEGNSWEKINTDFFENLYNSAVVNEKIWVVGEKGKILFSNNNGLTWQEQISGTTKRLNKVQFIDENYGWVITHDSLLLKTENGGLNWEIIKLDYKWSQNDFFFLNKNKGFLLRGNYLEPFYDNETWTKGAFLETNDGGKTWVEIGNNDTKYSSIFFLNDAVGYLSIHNLENGRAVLKTINGGITWDTLAFIWDWDEMYFYDEQVGLAIKNNLVYKTSSGGIDWSLKNEINLPDLGSRLTSILVENEDILIVGTEGNIIKSSDYGEVWKSIDSSIDFYYASLRGVTFKDKSIGFIYGKQFMENPLEDKAILMRTHDRGRNWERITLSELSDIFLIKHYDNNLWAASGTSLFHSIDDGNSWEMIMDVSINGDENLRDVHLFDNQHIVFLAGRRVYQSNDGGMNWIFSNEFEVQFLKKFIKITDEKWIVLGHGGWDEGNFITYDAGKTWSKLNSHFTAMQFIDENIGYAIDSALYKSSDGGISWQNINPSVKNISYWVSELFFANENVGWINSGDYLYSTKDGGINWNKEHGIKDLSTLYGAALDILSENEIWAVGKNGHIYRLFNDATIINRNMLNLSHEFILNQNYPNPFNPTTKISFTIPYVEDALNASSTYVRLVIYDILGREISTLINKENLNGHNEVEFDASHLSSGVYFYRLIFGEYSITKKMLLIK